MKYAVDQNKFLELLQLKVSTFDVEFKKLLGDKLKYFNDKSQEKYAELNTHIDRSTLNLEDIERMFIEDPEKWDEDFKSKVPALKKQLDEMEEQSDFHLFSVEELIEFFNFKAEELLPLINYTEEDIMKIVYGKESK